MSIGQDINGRFLYFWECLWLRMKHDDMNMTTEISYTGILNV